MHAGHRARPRGVHRLVAPALVVAALLVAALGVGGLLLVGGGEQGGTGARPAAGADAGVRAASGVDKAARDRAIRQVLERRAAAVLAGDEEAFLADVDPSREDFVDAQEQLFANLAQLDFAQWRYEPIGRAVNRPDLDQRYDGPFHLPALLLHYELEGWDAGPVARPQVLTFVQRDDRWLVASDSDADADLPQTGHADPWDRREIVVREGERVLLLADAEDEARADDLLAVAERGVRRVRAMWPDGWRPRVVVVAVRDQRLIETYFRTALQSSADVAAIAVPAYDVVPGWTPPGAPERDADPGERSRVILNPRYFDPDDDDNVNLLTHEVTHVATQGRTYAGAPTWLVEGVAEYTAYRHLRPFTVDLSPSLRREVRAGSLDLPTYDFYTRDVTDHYLAGFLATAYVAEEYGEPTLRRLYDRLAATRAEVRTLERQDEVVEELLGVPVAELQREAAAYAQVLAARE